jgi:hypothetical protein
MTMGLPQISSKVTGSLKMELVTNKLERLIGSGIVSRYRCEWERGEMERQMDGREVNVPRWNG